MSRMSKIMTISSPGSIRSGGNSNSSVSLFSILRFYLKLLIYILIVFFLILQYINWKHASTILHHHHNNANRKDAMSVLSQQQQQQQQQQLPNEITTKIHIVFSTGCNAFQDWQSYLFFHQIWKSGQMGQVTRVASCRTLQDGQVLKDVFQKEIQDGIPTGQDRFHLHITPDYSTLLVPGKTYKFFNKPCGLLHWMEHALNMPHSLDSEYADTLFIIMDPDQFILRPYTSNDFYRNVIVNQATHGLYWHTALPKKDKVVSNDKIDPNDYIVREGYPMAQLYMFGSKFMDRINKARDTIVQAANTMMYNNSAFQHIVSDTTWKSNLYRWTSSDVDNYYAAGPPYIALGRDMYRIVAVWAAVVVPVYHACDGEFLSEMYAYSTAAAHLNLPHLLGYNFMISEPGINIQEGWNDIDTIPNEQICYYTQNNNTDTSTVQWHDQYYPYVVHYCQRYYLGPYFFNKYRLPHKFLTCDHPLYLDPTTLTNTSIVDVFDSAITPDRTEYNNIPMIQRKREAIMLCIVIGGLNDAATYWKQQNCDSSSSISDTGSTVVSNVAAGNYEKVYFVPPDPEKKPRRKR